MTSTPLRIVSWNILEGFHRPGDTDLMPSMDPERLQAARQLILELEPDILVLNEALWCRPHNGHYVDYAKVLGFSFGFVDTYDGAWGNAILSQRPIENSRRFRIHNRGGLMATVAGDGGWSLNVATYHPHPGRYPSNKAGDYSSLLSPNLDRALVVCGDFNSISPDDQPDEIALTKAFSRFSSQPASDLARFTDGGRKVFEALKKLDLRDAMDVGDRKFTMPTDMISLDKTSAMRIDHIWVNPLCEVIKSSVIHHPLADLASDHYPVMAEIAPTTTR
jgi:endonuclease/exonuclease/phosphatase family metal-dependent hydrolase